MVCDFKSVWKISIKRFVTWCGGRNALAVSELVSFAAAVSGFTGFTDSGSRDKSFPLHKKFLILNGNTLIIV